MLVKMVTGGGEGSSVNPFDSMEILDKQTTVPFTFDIPQDKDASYMVVSLATAKNVGDKFEWSDTGTGGILTMMCFDGSGTYTRLANPSSAYDFTYNSTTKKVTCASSYGSGATAALVKVG